MLNGILKLSGECLFFYDKQVNISFCPFCASPIEIELKEFIIIDNDKCTEDILPESLEEDEND